MSKDVEAIESILENNDGIKLKKLNTENKFLFTYINGCI